MPSRWCTASSATTPAARSGSDSGKDLIGTTETVPAKAWAPTFDAIVALHRGDIRAALDRLAADLDDPQTWWHAGQIMYRPWCATVWAEAAVLAHHDDALSRIDRARHAARDNPIASAMVERAAAVAAGDRSAIENLAATFARLGCLPGGPHPHSRPHRSGPVK